MYGLNKELDLTFLQDRELIQVAIGVYQVVFKFDEQVSISVEGQFDYISKVGSSEWQPGAARVAADTVSLLGTKVTGVLGQEDGTLQLTFSTGDRLVIRDVSTKYESYEISRGGETIIV
jgi:hypothetical protein